MLFGSDIKTLEMTLLFLLLRTAVLKTTEIDCTCIGQIRLSRIGSDRIDPTFWKRARSVLRVRVCGTVSDSGCKHFAFSQLGQSLDFL